MSQPWRTGPIAITGATGQVGRALQKRLADTTNEVRPLGRGDRPRDAFADAETVVALAGTLRPRRPDNYRSANLDTARAAAAAIRGSAVRRVVFLSFLTARADAGNPYLRCKAQAEDALLECGADVTVLRCGHIYGPPAEPGPTATAFLARKGRVRLLGSGTQRLAPVFRDDVVEAVAHAALDPAAPSGTFELAGPETLTAAEFARRLNPAGVAIHVTPPTLARLLATVLPSLPGPLVDVMLRDAVPTTDPHGTAERFGIRLHPLHEIWPQDPGHTRG